MLTNLLSKAATVAMLSFVVSSMLAMGAGLTVTSALGVGIGWLLGGPDVDTNRVMALGTAQRNIAAALVVASQSFDDPKVVVMVIVVAIVGLIVLMPLSRALAKRGFAQQN
jgi:predicted permease